MVCNGATPDTLICVLWEETTLPWQHIQSTDIVQLVKIAVRLNPCDSAGFIIDKVRSHSLRARGAMAMFITKHDAVAIQKAGRWTSTTFLDYTHNQIDVVTQGVAQAMSTAIPFINMIK